MAPRKASTVHGNQPSAPKKQITQPQLTQWQTSTLPMIPWQTSSLSHRRRRQYRDQSTRDLLGEEKKKMTSARPDGLDTGGAQIKE
uniref:Uncharacterized protein n=1 Tax=Caenorhabditis tropicalis TaxID=1561998 RepID=A0A1I7THY6_9PELO